MTSIGASTRARLLLLSLLLLAACSSDRQATSSTTPKSPSATTTKTPASAAGSSACRGAAKPGRWGHVIWIWMENHSYGQVIGSNRAPYENSLAKACGLATNYHGVTHPSLPNYLAATGGTTAGVTSDCSPGPSCRSTRPSIFEQVAASRRQWRSYEESMRSNCFTASSDGYAVKHNPAPYYTRIAAQCRNWDVPYEGHFSSDLRAGSLPAFSFVTPNLCHDTHDCSVATGDAWLKSVVGAITGSSIYAAGRTVVFITWDEGYDSANHVPTIVVSPTTKPGARSASRYDHYSLLRTAEEMLRLPLLGRAATAASVRSPFGL